VTRHDRATAQRLKVWKLLELGLYPIPVNPASRKPLVAWGELDRLGYRPGIGQDLGYHALIFEWWDRWPTAGAAIMTGRSRLLVVDVDPRAGGHHALARLVAGRPLPPTRVVRSRAGGRHLYYRTDQPVPSRAGALGPGLDVKSRRGLITCPPTPGYWLLQPRPIARAPGWLLARLGPTSRPRTGPGPGTHPPDSPATRAALDRALAAIRGAPRGQRHDTVVREAARVFAVCDHDQVEAALLEAARQASEPSEWRDREQAIRDERAFIRQGQ
jgi:Bifunctional DNA primase/polymerase, N-terminal